MPREQIWQLHTRIDPAEAEPLLRECLDVRQKKLPDDWLTFNTQSLLGGSLFAQKKYAEAEPLLLAGYQGMKAREEKIAGDSKVRVKEALHRLVQLYDETGRANRATECKQKLAEFEKAEDDRKASTVHP